MYVAVDIGGTKTLVAVFTPNGEMLESQKFPTSQDFVQFKIDLAENVAKLSTNKFSIGAVGMRGNIDRLTGFSLMDDVLHWGQVNVRDDCANIFGCQFLIENDSKLAGLSEALLVRGEFRKVLYLTISTGIGSAFIVDSKLDQNTINSEVGKSIFEHEGTIQQWEDFASGKAIVAKYHQRASEIEDPVIWHEISKNLALGLVVVIASFTPEIVIFGGGVGAHFEKFEKPLREIVNEIKPLEITVPVLRKAKRPEEAVIYGCYELARQHHENSTS